MSVHDGSSFMSIVTSTKSRAAAIALSVSAVAVAVTLSLLFDDGILGNDYAQTVSVARNIVDGHGLKTSLIYYDVHYALEGPIVPQTVFPPGYAAVVAPLLWLDLPASAAIFSLCLAAFLGTGFLVALSVHRLGGGQLNVLLAGVTYLLAGTNWSNTLLNLSEVPFTFTTVVAMYLFLRWTQDSADGRVRLMLIGIAAACALLLRYQGLFFIASIGVLFAWRAIVGRDYRTLIDMLTVATIPCIVVVAVVGFNLTNSGGPGGGPVDYVRHAASMQEVIVEFYYEFSRILGVSKDSLVEGGLSELFVAAMFAYLLYAIFRSRFLLAVRDSIIRTPALQLCVIYIGITLFALFYLAFTKSIGYAQARYFSTLLPFFILIVAIVCHEFRGRVDTSKRLALAGIPVLIGVVVFGQAQATSQELQRVFSDDRMHEIRATLQTRLGDRSVGEILQEEIRSGNHVLANEAQLLGYLLDRTTYGLTPALFTEKVFDFEEVATMADKYSIKFVVLFPKIYRPHEVQNRNRVILTKLLHNNVPEWLSPVLQTDDIRVFEVI